MFNVGRSNLLAQAWQLATRGEFEALFEKASLRARSLVDESLSRLNIALARGYYSVPIGVGPRRLKRISTFETACRKVDRLPTDLAASGDWYLRIRPEETVSREPSIGLSDVDLEKFREGTAHFQGGRHASVPEVFLGCLNNARIVGPERIVFSARNQLMFESALSRRDVVESTPVAAVLRRSRAKRLEGNYCLLATPWSGFAYYHWVMDALPRLSVLEQFDELRDAKMIVPEPLTSYHRETLQLAGIRPDRLHGVGDGCWEVERLFFPQLLSASCNPSTHVATWLRQRFLGTATREPSGPKKIYVSRRDAKRQVLNEPDIISAMEARGFTVVCPGDLNFVQQVALFRQAEVVVGPHGAAFANMVFAPPGATLVEFFGDNYVNGCFWALANVCKQRHAFLISPTTTLDYEVPVARLESLLAALRI
jgi:hypothetical protein